MKNDFKSSILSISVYIAFSYFFWISRDVLTAGALLSLFFALSLWLRPLRDGIPFLLVLGFTHAICLALRSTPYLQWPLDFYLVAISGFAFARFILRRPLTGRLNWSFKFTKKQISSIFIINIPAILVLIWYYSQHKEIAQQWPLPDISIYFIPLVVLLIAAINGLREEIFYRGLLQTMSEDVFPVWAIILLQAVLFGSLHFIAAFPQGWLGVGLTAVWGAAIALQYHLFRSIALAWLTHAIADAVMFGIILYVR